MNGCRDVAFAMSRQLFLSEMNPHTEEQHRMIPFTRNNPLDEFVSPITYHITLFSKNPALYLRATKG